MFINKSVLLVVSSVLGIACTKEFQFTNKHSKEIWIGTQGNAGHKPINNGGWKMAANETITIESPENWSGRFWARTVCDPITNHCETGDCGNKVECNGAGGHPPATLIQITLKGGDGNDYYDISLVDGFNIQASITPVEGEKTGTKTSCKAGVCDYDINSDCPDELQVKNNDVVVACRSACSAFNNDQYCCRGAYNKPPTCKTADWPTNYAKHFKDRCPDAYSYAYDDRSSLYTCRSEKYLITFG